MATTIFIPFQSFSSLPSQNLHRSLTTYPLSSSFHFSAFLNKNMEKRRKHLPISSSAGPPSELTEDAKFVPLNAEDPIYGPPVLLLLGFEANETDKIKELLRKIDGEFLKVIRCTEDMLTSSVWDTIHTEPKLEALKISKSLPRICFLSGLTGEEMMMFIDAFPETGLEQAVFAAVVPNSANKILGDVVEEIMGDHEMMSSQSSS